MQPTLCSRCKKNLAVIFITKMEGNSSSSEGVCLKCARELGLKPVGEFMERMGITDDDIDAMSDEMLNMLENSDGMELAGLSGIVSPGEDTDESDPDSNTATFPFLNKLFGASGSFDKATEPGDTKRQPQDENDRRNQRAKKNVKRKYLENYCISLSQRAKEGKLDRIVGRNSEIERVIQILNRRQKNNPCLIGEPGVGKTAIAEGLAIRMSEGNVPARLEDREVYLLDLTALVAGTQFRGQFESRMKGLIDEIKKLGNIILVIDEVHNLVGAGDAEGSMNAANILKPALSRGEIQVIGATTFTEYRKHIEKDSALERRFQSVIVNEPSIEETVEIIKGIAHYYEDYHGVKITDKVAWLAVTLSERYITDRYLPDKAIDLIDEACSDLNLKSALISERTKISKDLENIKAERDSLLNDTTSESFERLAVIRSEECKMLERLDALKAQGIPELTIEHLAHVIELWTKIPASSIKETEFKKLSELETRLKKRIIGQDEAIKAVAAAIKRNRVGISPKRKPVSFLFIGPTGVGKTELVKCLARDLFNSPESLIRLDMSEFMEKHAVSRIIGAPPGYVGYDEAGQLTEKVRRKPYSIILFDEIEKAHPDVLNILLQILDDGQITDARGKQINFENTVIIMTSNAGSQNKNGVVGFGQTLSEQNKEKSLKALSEFMRPEFINRIDEVISFNNLPKEHFSSIAKIMLDDLTGSLKEKGIAFEYDNDLIAYLVEKSFSMKFGARNLRRVIQKELEDEIASKLIENYEYLVKQIRATAKDSVEVQIS